MKYIIGVFSYLFLVFLFFTLFSSSVLAVQIGENNQISLLSVTDYSNGSRIGDVAYLDLQIRPGSGAVFLDSFPATRIDTQVSARMANEIACEYSQVDCSHYDFFYTIKADASTIGGPSAGAAITLLTLSSLLDQPLKKHLAVTGAISSGGVILPVDGIKEKVDAAEKKGYLMVLIPKLAFSDELENKTNISSSHLLFRSQFENNSINIFEVISLGEAFELVTQNSFEFEQNFSLNVPDEYVLRMKQTAESLCNRTDELFQLTEHFDNEKLEPALSFINLSLDAKNNSQYYPQASFCYSANVVLRELVLSVASQDNLFKNYVSLNKSRLDFETGVDGITLKTFSDLETYSIVKERLLESQQYLDMLNVSDINYSLLASAIERYHSAVAWSAFFGMNGDDLNLDETSLRHACEQELQSVYTRNNYLQTFMPRYMLQDLFLEISGIVDYANDNENALCLFKASKAKSYADFLITMSSLNNDTIKDLVYAKQTFALNLISQQQQNNVFPILGFSYYEYSKSLESDSYPSSLMFAENSIAFSDLSKYFEKISADNFPIVQISFREWLFFIAGVLTGLFLGMLIFWRKLSSKKHKKHVFKSKHR